MEGTQRTLETLPPEQRGQALRFVPPRDLCNLVLTSSSMRTLASDPRLWSGTKVKKTKIKKQGLAKLFSIKRFSKIRKINVSSMTFTADKLLANLNAIVSSSVEDLNLYKVNLSKVPSEKLAQVAGHLRNIDLGYTNLTTEQCQAVLEACATSTSLVEVSLWRNVSISKVPATLLARAARHLHKIDLGRTNLTTEQFQAVLEVCATPTATSLVELSLAWSLLDQVPATKLAQAAKHLHKIDLGETNINTEQCQAVLEACVTSTSLVDLSLDGNDLNEVPAALLAQAAKHLRKIYLGDTHLTTEQCQAVLDVCPTSTTLKELSLYDNTLDQVPATLLAQAVKHLQIMDLNETELTTVQCIALLEACISSTKLVKLRFNFFKVDKLVDAELLERAWDTGCLQSYQELISWASRRLYLDAD